jgi:peptidyl-prolyl cis-trans isomerase SurA
MRSRSTTSLRLAATWLCGLVAVLAAPAGAQPTSPTRPSTSPATSAPLLPPPSSQSAPTVPTGPIDVDRVVAIADSTPILLSELMEEILTRAQGRPLPTDSAALHKLQLDVLNEMIDAELLVQKAHKEKVEVTDDDLARQVDAQIKQIRSQFGSEAEYRNELRKAGLGSPEDYRRRQMEALRKTELQRELFRKLRADNKLAPSPVTEAEVSEAYEQSKASLPKREASIGFKQVVVAAKPTAANKAAARAKAESLLVELAKGGEFELVAKRESMDPGSKELGGDLGWNRRGKMLKEFDDMMFALPPGRLSPIVETAYGFHIIRVDRVQPAEVKARHILIRPKIDSTDVARARIEADSIRTALEKGADIDSIIAKHHDPVENSSLPEFPKAQLPPAYATAIGDAATGALVGPFTIDDPANSAQKFVVLRVTTSIPAGDYPEAEVRLRLREQVSEGKTVRKLVDSLRKASYVSVRLTPTTTAARTTQ